MAHLAIYRKWRPMVFEDIVGQGHITQTLKNQILNDKIGHAYLFCGTRGTGKTTCAKVLSRAVNCLNPHDGSPCNECEVCKGILDGSILDVKEIDAASNNAPLFIRFVLMESGAALPASALFACSLPICSGACFLSACGHASSQEHNAVFESLSPSANHPAASGCG